MSLLMSPGCFLSTRSPSDGTLVREHGERDHADGLRERAGGGGAEGELQQPRQSRGVPADRKSHGDNSRISHAVLRSNVLGTH